MDHTRKGAGNYEGRQYYTISEFAEAIGMNKQYFARRYVRPMQRMFRIKFEQRPIYMSDLNA